MTLTPFPAMNGGDGAPAEPDWASAYSDELDIAEAHEQWGFVIREMQDASTLTVANGHAIKRLVEFRVQYERASRQVCQDGPVLKARRSRVPQYNPFWVVMRQADEAIRSAEAELGIAPARRGKVMKVQRGKKAARPSDAYLKAARS